MLKRAVFQTVWMLVIAHEVLTSLEMNTVYSRESTACKLSEM